jgi:hypothetical protein
VRVCVPPYLLCMYSHNIPGAQACAKTVEENQVFIGLKFATTSTNSSSSRGPAWLSKVYSLMA